MAETDQPDTNINSDSLAGHFLIAMPSLDDGYFNQSVTYICEHNESGSFGIVINQKAGISLKQIAKEMKISSDVHYDENKAVYIGGPVEQGRGFILHNPPGNWQSSLNVNEDISLTSSRDILEAMINNEGPEDSIVALGYAGWAAGQLEEEIANNTWLSCPAENQIIFNTPTDKRWLAAAKLIGIDLTLLSSETGHA